MFDFKMADAINQLVWSTVGNAAAQEAIDGMARELDERGGRPGFSPKHYREAVALARTHARYKHG